MYVFSLAAAIEWITALLRSMVPSLRVIFLRLCTSPHLLYRLPFEVLAVVAGCGGERLRSVLCDERSQNEFW